MNTLDAKALLDKLAELGITASLDRAGLRFRPAERLPPELRQAVVAHRRELAALLAARQQEDLPAVRQYELAELLKPADPLLVEPVDPALLVKAASPTAPVLLPAEVASTPDSSSPAAREQSGKADGELLRAHRLAKLWATARTRLEQLVLSVARRKSWPCLELQQGAHLPPGRQTWERHVRYPCVTPEHLVSLLESLSRK